MANNDYDWPSIIRSMAPSAKPSIVNGLASAMPQIIQTANLNNKYRLGQFLAQIAHESDGFRTTTEYASGAAYNNRADLGNGPTDGPRYKGRGLIQITGKNNYRKYGSELGVDFINNPQLAAQFPYAALTAALYWKNNNLNKLADIGDINGITRKINGGYNGLADRRHYLALANSELNPVKLAQKRLTQLNYPTGGADGVAGPLTRSAVRDFQDAAKLPVTGELTPETINLLHSDDAPVRPVSPDRAAMTVDNLRQSGSKIIEGTDEVKWGAVGGGLATAAGATSQVSDIVSNVKNIASSTNSGTDYLTLLKMYWPAIFGVVATIVACYFAWKCYQGAQKAEQTRLKNAQTGANVMR